MTTARRAATGLIAQLLLLAVLADRRARRGGWIVGSPARDHGDGAGARPRASGRLGPASWVTLARATLAVGVAALAADSLANDPPVALLVTLAAVALCLDLVDGWVARRTGMETELGARLDGEVDAFLILALSVYVAPRYGRMGAGDRSRALPVPRRRVAAAVDARAAAAAPLAQARRGHAGSRADGRGRRGPAAGAHPGPPPRRARPAHGVDGGVHVVAVAARARRPARTAARRRRRDGHGARPAARMGRPRRAAPAERPQPRLVRAAPARASRRRRGGRPAARPPAPRAGRGPRNGPERARAREDPRHRVLHGVRPPVQAARRFELRGDRHRDAGRGDRHVGREPRRRRRGRPHHRDPGHSGPGAAAGDAGCGRPPRLGAPGGGPARRASGWLSASSARRSPPRAPPPWPSTRCRGCGPPWRVARRSPAR